MEIERLKNSKLNTANRDLERVYNETVCIRCKQKYVPEYHNQKYCSLECKARLKLVSGMRKYRYVSGMNKKVQCLNI